jgi:hypothetical protein
VWIAEDAAHRGQGAKAGEAIRIPQPLLSLEENGHENISAVCKPSETY